ncbi:unnamed protein product [Acanthosepion pharaonis]|uniref:Uncharacterized protein n=1 Tax=Acanthosepion pharaonis TaxID=158019 RepID=A0A812B658_ACAPH|nr:unnamed protein product [Sepia pharaonis]
MKQARIVLPPPYSGPLSFLSVVEATSPLVQVGPLLQPAAVDAPAAPASAPPDAVAAHASARVAYPEQLLCCGRPASAALRQHPFLGRPAGEVELIHSLSSSLLHSICYQGPFFVSSALGCSGVGRGACFVCGTGFLVGHNLTRCPAAPQGQQDGRCPSTTTKNASVATGKDMGISLNFGRVNVTMTTTSLVAISDF